MPTAPSGGWTAGTSCSMCFSATKPKAARRTSICAVLGETVESIPLLGPGSPASYQTCDRGMVACGTMGRSGFPRAARAGGVRHGVVLACGTGKHRQRNRSPAISSTPRTSRIAHYGAVRLNEFYVSQYVDHAPLDHPPQVWPSPRGRTSRWAGAARGRSSDRWAKRFPMPPTRSSSTASPPARVVNPPL